MPLNRATGNMYPWVTHTHTHLGGECPHRCQYCYVNRMKSKPSIRDKYSGPLRIIESELSVNYGSGKTIFMEHCNDLFASDVPSRFICSIIAHADRFPCNGYVWQTKNPRRMEDFSLPVDSTIGVTIETNRQTPCSLAPSPMARFGRLLHFKRRVFITIEPIMDFDLDHFTTLINEVRPIFVNIGADSKRSDLPEPSKEKVLSLIKALDLHGIPVNLKPNLARIIGQENLR